MIHPDGVSLWFRETHQLDDDAVLEAEATLAIDERARQARFHRPEDRRDYAVAHDLLRRALSLGRDVPPQRWQFAVAENGKPFIQSPVLLPPLFISLSHTRGAVACAATTVGPVGVDIERVQRFIDAHDLDRSVFTPRERTELNEGGEEADRRRCELWTLKEALLKATGDGLAKPLDGVGFALDLSGQITFETTLDLDVDGWDFSLYAPSTDVRIAAAVKRGRDTSTRFVLQRMDRPSRSDPTLAS